MPCMTASRSIRKSSSVNYKNTLTLEEIPQYPDWSDKHIIIAEDLNDNFAVLMALLQITGIKIKRAVSGKEAVELAIKYPETDLILMDISMPDMDGISAMHMIRERFPDKVIIAQTAHEPVGVLPMDDFNEVLQKPLRRKMLIATMGKYIS